MKISVKNVSAASLAFVIFLAAGCATTKGIWTSKPVVQTSGNPYYEAGIEPLKQGKDYYVTFRFQVTNKTKTALRIDWNRTTYLLNGQGKGLFVFKGIKPEDIRNRTIPDDIIEPGETFSKIIAPYALLARAPSKYSAGEDSTLSAGILPAGENGLHLFIKQGDRDIVEKIVVVIKKDDMR